MIVAALVLHALLLLVALPPRQPPDRTTIKLQWVDVDRPATPGPTPVEMTPPKEQRPPEAEPEPEPITPSATATARSAPASEPDEPADPVSAAPSGQRLRELALIAGRAQTERTSPAPSGLAGFAVPRLPGQAGWLNDHVGTVTPHADRWLEPDGASAARAVTASGQVFCGRARAPTAAEEFNPWMSAVVMTWRPCGRERPEPVDRSNPWVRGQGRRGN